MSICEVKTNIIVIISPVRHQKTETVVPSDISKYLFMYFCSNLFKCPSYATLSLSASARKWRQAAPRNGGCSKSQPSMESRSVRGKYPYTRDHNDTHGQCTVADPLKLNGIKFLKHCYCTLVLPDMWHFSKQVKLLLTRKPEVIQG